MREYTKATLTGMLAPLCWGTTVGLVRTITEQFGLSAGLTFLYAFIVIMLLGVLGVPKLGQFPKKYLLFGLPWANLCSILFCVSMYMCQNERQTVEVGMVNYMWPCLVVLFAVIINHQKARWWLTPALLISVWGIMIVTGGEQGADFKGMLHNIGQNPYCYLLAFLGAVSWGIYSNLTRRFAAGANPTILIFFIDFLIFGSLWLCGWGCISGVNTFGWLSVAIGAVALGGGYAAWNYGIAKGNITILAVSSYFTPVLSCIFASIWIGATLSFNLIVGVGILVLGSILTWSATEFANQK